MENESNNMSETNKNSKIENKIKRIDKKLSRKYPVFIYEIFEHAIETRNEKLREKRKMLEDSMPLSNK